LTKNLKLGEILKQAGIIDDFQLNSALSYQRHWGGRFGESLIKLGYLSEEKLQDFLARQFDLPLVELFGRRIDEDVLAYIPLNKAREFHVLPVERREVSGTMHLVVAMTDPTNLMVIDSLQFMTGCRIKPALASADAIQAAIEKHYGAEAVGQKSLDLTVEDFIAPPTAPQAVAGPPPASAQSDGLSATALKRLEERYENLVRILLDKGIVDAGDLDELM
jgi:type IV pilus assembly protein PilB